MPGEKISEEEMKQLIDPFHERIRKIDPLVTHVLQAHLIVEEELDATLRAVAKNPRHLGLNRNPKFEQKVKWIRAFAPLGDDGHWEVILAINRLRNKVAHQFDGPERKTALQNLRAQFNQFVSIDKSALNEQEWKDYNVVLGACVYSIFFLVQVRDELRK
jgi:hypothetical protein